MNHPSGCMCPTCTGIRIEERSVTNFVKSPNIPRLKDIGLEPADERRLAEYHVDPKDPGRTFFAPMLVTSIGPDTGKMLLVPLADDEKEAQGYLDRAVADLELRKCFKIQKVIVFKVTQ